MAYRVVPCTSPRAVEKLINGTLALGAFSPGAVLPIGGLTLIFSTPSHTVTFGSAGDILTVQDVAEAIKATSSDFNSFVIRQSALEGQSSKLELEISNDAGFVINKDGTANAYLRLSTTADTTNSGALDATEFQVVPSSISGQFIVILGSTS